MHVWYLQQKWSMNVGIKIIHHHTRRGFDLYFYKALVSIDFVVQLHKQHSAHTAALQLDENQPALIW